MPTEDAVVASPETGTGATPPAVEHCVIVGLPVRRLTRRPPIGRRGAASGSILSFSIIQIKNN
jgi:hypothetical protein